MLVDGKKINYKYIMFTIEEGNLIISFYIIRFANAGRYFEEIQYGD